FSMIPFFIAIACGYPSYIPYSFFNFSATSISILTFYSVSLVMSLYTIFTLDKEFGLDNVTKVVENHGNLSSNPIQSIEFFRQKMADLENDYDKGEEIVKYYGNLSSNPIQSTEFLSQTSAYLDNSYDDEDKTDSLLNANEFDKTATEETTSEIAANESKSNLDNLSSTSNKNNNIKHMFFAKHDLGSNQIQLPHQHDESSSKYHDLPSERTEPANFYSSIPWNSDPITLFLHQQNQLSSKVHDLTGERPEPDYVDSSMLTACELDPTAPSYTAKNDVPNNPTNIEFNHDTSANFAHLNHLNHLSSMTGHNFF
ncbi:MAG: hypothetical protein VX335_05240, partial [Pseudomonadota bacterium]|nr:hypothetical protein [Pseudomonadota bacterium]